jgi:hypothetical protein
MPAPVAVVFAAQSNIGLGMSTGTLPDHLIGPIPNTYAFYSTSNYWGAVDPGHGNALPNTPGTWGAAEEFAFDFHRDHPDTPLLMIEVAKGSTGVAADPHALDWSPSSPGEMFDLTTTTIAKAFAAYEAATGEPAPKVSATIFLGMETDATDQTKAAAAHEDLTGLVSAIRDQWMHDADGHVIISRIGDDPVLPFNLAVRQAQWLADQEDPNLDSVKTVGMERQPDHLHWAASTHVAVGDAVEHLFSGWL